MAQQIYTSVPVLDSLVRSAEHYMNAYNVRAMAAGILAYYFPAQNGFSVLPRQNRANHYADFIIIKIHVRWLGDEHVVDHTLVETRRAVDPLGEAMASLMSALDHANAEHDRCWALLFHGVELRFYEYHRTFPLNNRLVQWAAHGHWHETCYHMRNDAETIDQMLRYMADTPIPYPRQFEGLV